MSNQWSASNYRANKAKRLSTQKAEWVTNPDTGEKFQLRKVGTMAPMLAGFLPNALTTDAINAWKEKGVEVEDGPKTLTPEVIEEGQKDLKLMAKVIAEACVCPKIVAHATKDDEIEMSDLDDSDVLFIFRWASGQVGGIGVGGQVMSVTNLKSLPKKPGRRIRAGNGSAELQREAV
jgi:hypothetical protein